MDLSTEYLGLHLPHPFIAGASPLSDTVDAVRRLEDAGASALVMRSLFQEQIDAESMATFSSTARHAESFPEALTYFADPDEFVIGPDEYLDRLRDIKEAVSIPVIGSLNGTTTGGWVDYAKQMQQAGADALELNEYQVVTDPELSAANIEDRGVELVGAVMAAVEIPVAVKLSPFYTSLLHFVTQLVEAGAAGIVVFNRYFEPDLDIEELEAVSHLRLSDSSELLLRLRWLALLSAGVPASFAVTGGVHTMVDAIKAIMCGADAVQLVSVLLRNGPEHITTLRDEVSHWLVEHEYDSLDQMKGSMNARCSPNPAAYERGNYMHMLQTWQPE